MSELVKNIQGEEEFNAAIVQGIVLVDFWGEGCPPCRALAPILDEVAKDFEGKISFYKMNANENLTIARKFGIMSVPTLLVFKNGELADKSIGMRPKTVLIKQLTEISK